MKMNLIIKPYYFSKFRLNSNNNAYLLTNVSNFCTTTGIISVALHTSAFIVDTWCFISFVKTVIHCDRVTVSQYVWMSMGPSKVTNKLSKGTRSGIGSQLMNVL